MGTRTRVPDMPDKTAHHRCRRPAELAGAPGAGRGMNEAKPRPNRADIAGQKCLRDLRDQIRQPQRAWTSWLLIVPIGGLVVLFYFSRRQSGLPRRTCLAADCRYASSPLSEIAIMYDLLPNGSSNSV
jgi:hypothetical protein